MMSNMVGELRALREESKRMAEEKAAAAAVATAGAPARDDVVLAMMVNMHGELIRTFLRESQRAAAALTSAPPAQPAPSEGGTEARSKHISIAFGSGISERTRKHRN
jgi:hypothetical protein